MAAAEFVAEGNAAASWRQGGATDESDDVESEGCSTPMLVGIVVACLAVVGGIVMLLYCFCGAEQPQVDEEPAPPTDPQPEPQPEPAPRVAGVTEPTFTHKESQAGVDVVSTFTPSEGALFTVKASPTHNLARNVAELGLSMFAVNFENEADAKELDANVEKAAINQDFVTIMRAAPGCSNNECDPRLAQHQLVVKTINPLQAQAAAYGSKWPYDTMYVPTADGGKVKKAADKQFAVQAFQDTYYSDYAKKLASRLTEMHDKTLEGLKQFKTLSRKDLDLEEATTFVVDDDDDDMDEEGHSTAAGVKVCRQIAELMVRFYKTRGAAGATSQSIINQNQLELRAPTGDRMIDGDIYGVQPLFTLLTEEAVDSATDGLQVQRNLDADFHASRLVLSTKRNRVGMPLRISDADAEKLHPNDWANVVKQHTQLTKNTNAAEAALLKAFGTSCIAAQRDNEKMYPKQALRKTIPFGNNPKGTGAKANLGDSAVGELQVTLTGYLDDLIEEAESWSKLYRGMAQKVENEADKLKQKHETTTRTTNHARIAKALKKAQTTAKEEGYELPATVRFVVVGGRMRLSGDQSTTAYGMLGFNATTLEWPRQKLRGGQTFLNVPRMVVRESRQRFTDPQQSAIHAAVAKVTFRYMNKEHARENLDLHQIHFPTNAKNKEMVDPLAEVRARFNEQLDQAKAHGTKSGGEQSAGNNVQNRLRVALTNVEKALHLKTENSDLTAQEQMKHLQKELRPQPLAA